MNHENLRSPRINELSWDHMKIGGSFQPARPADATGETRDTGRKLRFPGVQALCKHCLQCMYISLKMPLGTLRDVVDGVSNDTKSPGRGAGEAA